MKVSVVRPAELGRAEIATWNQFRAKSACLANPFLSPEFAIAVASVKPEARVAVLSNGDTIDGFFPFERRPLGIGAPIGVPLSNCQGLVHAPGFRVDAKRLLRECRLSAWTFDHLAVGQLCFEPYQLATFAAPVIDLASGFEPYYAALRARSKDLGSKLDRKTRKLAREVGEIRFDPDIPDARALARLISWKSAQYTRSGMVNPFDRPWAGQLLEQLLGARGEGLHSMLSCLYAGDRLVGVHYGLRSGPVLAGWFTGYDVSFGGYSPGLRLMLGVAESAAAAGVRLVDLGKGTLRYKESLKTGDIYVGEGVVTGRQVIAAACRLRQRAVAWSERRMTRTDERPDDAIEKALRQYWKARAYLQRAAAGQASAREGTGVAAASPSAGGPDA